MKTVEPCSYTRIYSEIQGLQTGRTLTYSVSHGDNGLLFLLEQKIADEVATEACICSSVSLTDGCSLLKYLYENSFGLGCWLDLLDDLNIAYQTA